ncbi:MULTISPECIES: dihydrolipoamide acetyltransferase family protein [unclassified Sphingomonas]|uniref:dihydrolipoamide acetyltransferase family protein n=1 Tax=unclassified Sphingomonas TaxID=196159 RepID=UPI0006FC3A4C|nr:MULTISPECIES: dihydrolipoamide acetyltransferase family protein [unclassified Sphingomonas]KQX18769.1 dehydrogenase [Sphingomonas sp. Root1294]KQY71907.1 dehydrogenase [Sphingomonas sp. Root50]KRB94829.1 dehydrogenase [Sphingomonas sp. Root720]
MSDPASGGGAPIVMPKLGLTMAEGLIAEWKVRAGETVCAGQVLFVVETDKISNEIEAPADGTILALLAEEGATVAVGAAVATWTGPGQGVGGTDEPGFGTAPAAIEDPASAAAIPAAPTVQAERRLCTPFARRLARQAGIDLDGIEGSGARGRIKARDVQAAIDGRAAGPVTAPRGRDLRSLIAARVSRSKAEIPHFYLSADAAFDALAGLRRDLNADPLAPRKLSITALLGAAVGRALALHPEANGVWRDGRVQPLGGVAIGIAVEAPGGVMAPVVPLGAGIYDFAASLDAAIGRARLGRLGSGDVGEAAIGISNVGMFNVRSLTPIIDPDQSFMLGVGAPRTAFRADDKGAPVALREVTLNLACDHRAIDGAAAARFLATIVELIENPVRLLLPAGRR